jgi:hypothetical protein
MFTGNPANIWFSAGCRMYSQRAVFAYPLRNTTAILVYRLLYILLKNKCVENYFSFSFSGLFRHQFASNDPEIVIHGTEMADAKPTVAIFPICIAIPEASPPFCIPTSNEIVLQVASSSLKSLPLQ